MPPVIPEYDQTYKKACIELAKRWVSWNESEPCPFNKTDVEKLMPMQKVSFLNQLFESNDKFSVNKLKILAEKYELSSNKNAEIRFVDITLKKINNINPYLHSLSLSDANIFSISITM